jgi:hypothetical protein
MFTDKKFNGVTWTRYTYPKGVTIRKNEWGFWFPEGTVIDGIHYSAWYPKNIKSREDSTNTQIRSPDNNIWGWTLGAVENYVSFNNWGWLPLDLRYDKPQVIKPKQKLKTLNGVVWIIDTYPGGTAIINTTRDNLWRPVKPFENGTNGYTTESPDGVLWKWLKGGYGIYGPYDGFMWHSVNEPKEGMTSSAMNETDGSINLTDVGVLAGSAAVIGSVFYFNGYKISTLSYAAALLTLTILAILLTFLIIDHQKVATFVNSNKIMSIIAVCTVAATSLGMMFGYTKLSYETT